MLIDRERVVFIRVGWMTYYGYVDDGTRPKGGGSHNLNKEGAESLNFRFDEDGKCLG